jgi:uncharacterized membrane protein YccC
MADEAARKAPLHPEDLAGLAAAALDVVGRALTGVGAELRTIEWRGAQARQATITSIVVAISTCVALAMHVPDVWWAAISGLMSTQATRPASVRKGVLRMVGTVAGATLGLVSASWLAYDHFACCLALFAMGLIGILGVIVSPHGYAWLFSAITFAFVLLDSLQDPSQALIVAVYRTLEVGIGTAVAMLVTIAVAADEPEGAATSAEPPGWSDLLGARWPAVLHAVRSGVAVAAIPVVWSWLYVPGVTSMAMTLASVLSVPVLSDHPLDDAGKLVEKAMHRVLGCVLGGSLAVLLLATPLTALFLPWLAVLTATVWVSVYVQGSQRGVGYIGTQAGIVFIIVLVQGPAPPDSLIPALNRLAGIICGLMTLFLVSLLVQPSDDRG